jgi:DHA1 family tetracycline resistance protein-like MFS transporter
VTDVASQGWAAPRLQRRFGEQTVAAGGLALNGIGLLLLGALALDAHLALLCGGVALFTFGDGLFQPSANALVAAAAPAGRQGAVQGANQAQQSIARMGGPMAAAWLYGWWAGAPYAAAALAVLLAAVLLWRRRWFAA